MRIWDIEPKYLCRQHLLGEHRELHALWTVLTQNKRGYSKHPETLRWVDKQNALFLRHELLVQEMQKRGYTHKTPLDKHLAKGSSIQTTFIHSIEQQKDILFKKGCKCILDFKTDSLSQ